MLSRRHLLPAAVSVTTLATALTGLTAAPPAAEAAGRTPAVVAHPDSPRVIEMPSVNRRPSARFLRGCGRVRQKVRSQRHCTRVAVRSFDRARAAEGLGPMALPHDFSKMSPATQLLAVTNIERVDRGLRPARMSASLNRLAQYGARHRTDPPLSRRGTEAASNWAGVGRSVLLADFEWTYDDGPGSDNAACGSGGGGCWGHRENVLGHYAGPLRLGAAWSADRYYGASITSEWVAHVRGDRAVGPRWRWLARQIPVRVAPRAVHSRRPGSTRDIELSASGRSMRVTVYLSYGGRTWSVSRHSLRLQAGHVRFVGLTFHPRAGSPRHGTLVVRGPNTERTVPLSA